MGGSDRQHQGSCSVPEPPRCRLGTHRAGFGSAHQTLPELQQDWEGGPLEYPSLTACYVLRYQRQL